MSVRHVIWYGILKNPDRNPDYTYLATRQLGNRIIIVAKTVKGTKPKTDPNDIRMDGINMMLARLYQGTSTKELAAKAGMSGDAVNDRLNIAKSIGVPEVAREIFIKEFLPASMAVLQEALVGEDLKLAVQVALKVVAGLEVMENPDKQSSPVGEPESLEAWRVKFTKPKAVEGVVVKQTRMLEEDLSESSGTDKE